MPSRSMPGRASSTMAALGLTIVLIAAGLCLGQLLPPGPFRHGGGLAVRIVNMDGVYYQRIAASGYQWLPPARLAPGQSQSLAFFPAFPLILAAIRRVAGASPLIIPATSLLFGLFGIAAFARLAGAALPARPAATATLMFAAWPALNFLVMGYPAGLINLCAAACLFHHIARQPLRAALWCGLGTAAGPIAVFIAAAFCADLALGWLKTPKTGRRTLAALGLCLLSVWGLLGYMAYQQIAFHDPLAFMAAQSAFGAQPRFAAHLARLFSPAWYAFPFAYLRSAATAFWQHDTVHTRQNLAAALQLNQSLAAILLTLAGIAHAVARRLPLILPLSAGALLLGYLWFLGTTDFQLLNGPRLLYPAFAIFLLLASAPWPRAVLVGLGALGVLDTALAAAGYGVI